MRVALSAADSVVRARLEAALVAAGHEVVDAGAQNLEAEIFDGATGLEAAEYLARRDISEPARFVAGLTDAPEGVAAALAGGAAEVYPAGDAAALLTRLAVLASSARWETPAGLLADHANDAIYVIEFDGTFSWVNAAAERLTGYPKSRLIGMHVSELVRDPADLARVKEELRAKRDGRVEGSFFEVRITAASGHTIPVEVNSRVILREGRPLAVEGVARDLRSRRHSEGQLRRESELFAQLGVAAVALDAERKVVGWNREAERLFGLPAERVVGTTPYFLMVDPPPDAGADVLGRIEAGEVLRAEMRLLRSDGSEFPALVSAAPFFDEQGRRAGISAVVTDLTVEREQQRRVEQLAAVVAASDDAVTTYDAAGRITGWNAAAERIYGAKAEEVLGLPAWELAPPAEREERKAMVEAILRGESISGWVVRRDGPQGMAGWLSLSAFPLRDADGQVTGAAAVARDITALVEAEREVSWLAAIIGSADDAVIGRDNDGRITSWNAAAERLFGYTAEEMIGTFGEATVPEERLDAYRARLSELLGNTRTSAEVFRKHRSGRVFPVRAVSFPVVDGKGRRLGSASFLRDISGEWAIREALEERERQLRALFESAGEAIVIVDRERRIRWLNQNAVEVAERSFGDRPSGGDSIHRWVRDRDLPAWEEAFETALRGEAVVRLGRLRWLDGGHLWFEMTFRPVRGEGGAIEAVALVGRDVTDRVEAERAVREREATLRSVFESTRDHLWLLDREGRLVTCNTVAAVFSEALFGRRPAQGDAMLDFADREGRPLLERALERAGLGESLGGEVAVPQSDGTKLYFNIQVNPVRDEGGQVRGILVAARDVTEEARARKELKRAREALEAEYAKLSTIIENSDEGIILLDREGRILAFNTEFAEGTRKRRGVSPVVGMHFAETVSPESAPFLLERVREALNGHKVAFEVESRSPGERRWFEVRIRPVLTQDGWVSGAVYTGRDVTERKRLEAEAQQAHANYRAVVENTSDAIFVLDVEETSEGRVFRVVLLNQAFTALTGVDGERARGKDVRRVLRDSAVAANAVRWYESAIAAGSITYEEAIPRDPPRWISVTMTALRDETGRCYRIVGSARDMTEKRQRERELAESAADLAATLSAIHEGLTLIRADGVILAANRATQELVASLTGVRPEVGMHWRDVLPEPWQEAFATMVAKTLMGEPSNFEHRLTDVTGEERWLELSFGRVELADGTVRGIALGVRDVTERKRTEERLLQAQKAESLAVLAGGIAHDFNNLLVGILGNAGLALAELPQESPVRPIVEEIELAGHRAAELARQMLAYSGRGKFVVQPLSLNTLVEELTHLLRASVSAGVQLVLDLDPGIPPVVADATQLRQVLMNLVINASDAIGPEEGMVRIRTTSAKGSPELFARAVVTPHQLADSYVVLEVADTGSGMDEATLGRIFDPFFTTKFTGRGLGLAAVLGIVRGHRGGIAVESALGRGTRFRVMLPASGETASDQGSKTEASRWRGSGTILIADDEPSVRGVTARALRGMGFAVIEAADGQEALERFEAERERIRLVFLDMTMPRMNGAAAFRGIRALDPGAKIVLMSGYTEQDAAEQFGEGLAGFLQKPYELGTLQALVRRLVEDSAG